MDAGHELNVSFTEKAFQRSSAKPRKRILGKMIGNRFALSRSAFIAPFLVLTLSTVSLQTFAFGKSLALLASADYYLADLCTRKEMLMGEIYLELTVANLHDLDRQKEIAFLVDTGASRAWVPQKVAEELGIDPIGSIELELADGNVKEFPYGSCFFDFGGERIAGNVVIGPPNSEPIVGTHVLQDFRLVIDMERHAISRSRVMRAK
ncbi:aspartyl protease family protein [candidate division KSB1 bacterium]|nr:aspartyl protease family protein [candidate division KSB1 bacterium]